MESLLSKYLQITLVVLLYWVVSIVTVFMNKGLLSGSGDPAVTLEAPVFIAWFQCVVSALVCFLLATLSEAFPHIFTFPKGNPFRMDVATKVVPVSLLFAGMICFNNLCLKYVGVAFYYVGRSLTTVFNVIFTYIVLGERTSLRCVLCCLVIIGGFLLGVNEESDAGSLSVVGVACGVAASLCVALYSIYTKRVLPAVGDRIWLLSFYNNVYSSLALLPLVAVAGELPLLLAFPALLSPLFWLLMVAGGLCGLAIGYVTSLQIKVTSPLTHNISGTAKACVQTVLATHWYNDAKSPLWWLSNAVVLCGSAGYTRARQLDLRAHFRRKVTV